MTKREWNAKVKKLYDRWKAWKEVRLTDSKTDWDELDSISEEFSKLIRVGDDFNGLNDKNVKRLLIMCESNRFCALRTLIYKIPTHDL